MLKVTMMRQNWHIFVIFGTALNVMAYDHNSRQIKPKIPTSSDWLNSITKKKWTSFHLEVGKLGRAVRNAGKNRNYGQHFASEGKIRLDTGNSKQISIPGHVFFHDERDGISRSLSKLAVTSRVSWKRKVICKWSS